MEEPADARPPADEAREGTRTEMVEQLEGTRNIIRINSLFDPCRTGGHGKTHEDRGFADALSNDGQCVAKVLKDVIPREERYLPLVECAGGGLVEADVPASDLSTGTRYTGMLVASDEGHANWEVSGKVRARV